jgi:hypothetical protein
MLRPASIRLIKFEGTNMKKSKSEKLELKKITLRNLDETMLDAVAGGNTLLTNYTCITNCIKDTCNKCG